MRGMPMERVEQALEHIEFQISLLRLTAVPANGSAARSVAGSVAPCSEDEQNAERALEQITEAVAALKR